MQLKIVAKKRKELYNMSKIQKEIERLKSKPKDYTYVEAKSLLNKLGFLSIIKEKHQVQEWNLKVKMERK